MQEQDIEDTLNGLNGPENKLSSVNGSILEDPTNDLTLTLNKLDLSKDSPLEDKL